MGRIDAGEEILPCYSYGVSLWQHESRNLKKEVSQIKIYRYY